MKRKANFTPNWCWYVLTDNCFLEDRLKDAFHFNGSNLMKINYVEIKHPFSEEYTEMIAFEDGDGIEYTRTDAFIDNACEWLKDNIYDYFYWIEMEGESEANIKDTLFDDFKKAMKG